MPPACYLALPAANHGERGRGAALRQQHRVPGNGSRSRGGGERGEVSLSHAREERDQAQEANEVGAL
jgi:hypothetical protein